MSVCDIHPFETLAEIGRMTEDGPIEETCQFCMNGFGAETYLECLHAPEGKCTGTLRVVFGISGMALVMCDYHETDMYERQDAINRNYR